MKIYDTIKSAKTEYSKNGRSEKFVAMEDEVINSGKMTSIYFFARYVEGADISKFQSIMLKEGTMEECFYFILYVKGVDITPFLKRAIKENEAYWVNKFVKIAMSPNHRATKFEKVLSFEEDLKKFGITFTVAPQTKNATKTSTSAQTKKVVKGVKASDPDNLIEDANNEFEKHGRTPKFVEYEQEATYSTGVADLFLFARNVKGADISRLQNAMRMHGSAFNMYLLAQEVERSDKELLLNGIKLAKFDYVEFNRIEKRHIERLTSLDKQLKELLNNKHNNTNPKEAKKISTKIAEIEKTIREVEGEMSYIDMCNIYQRRVEGLISSRAK